MTITLKDLKHLEVMSTLENATPRKAPEINIKELLAEKTDREPTLNENIVSLCTKLRTEGFDKQADSLETKFLAYKVAATHLYRTHDEDGEDLIDFAHPDGEVKIEDATKDLGHVETIVTQHKKLVDIVNKNPTGKLASKYNEAFKYIVAQDINQLDTVNLQEIARKFQYMADYLRKHFSTENPPQGSTLQPEARNFYGLIGLWQDLGQLIATELNHNQVMPIPQAMQLVKNRLQNSFNNAKQYVSKINHVSDIDKLVSRILGWAEDNNPMKKSALHAYIDRIKVAQQSTNPEWDVIRDSNSIDTLYNMGFQKLKQVFAEVLQKEELDEWIFLSAGGTDRLGTFLNDIASWSNVNYASSHLNAMNSSIDRFQDKKPINAELIKIIGYYEYAFEQLINKVDAIPLNRKNQYINKARIAYSYIQQAKAKLLDDNGSSKSSLPSNNSPASSTPNNAAMTAIVTLNNMAIDLPKRKIPQEKQQKALEWIKNQVQEIKNNANNPEKMRELLEDNIEFERQLKVLEGK